MSRTRLNRATVMEAAAVAVDTDGRSELSLGRLAADLGVQPSALYNHVDGIDGLRHDLSVHATENLANHLRNSLVARSGFEAVRSIARAYREHAHAHPGQFAAALLPTADTHDQLIDAHSRIAELFISVVESIGLSGERGVHAARLLRSSIHGFVALEAIDAHTNPVSRDASFEKLIDFTISALEP